MTLVAIIKSGNQHYLIGDVLGSAKTKMNMPLISGQDPNKIKYKNPKLQASGYTQKINIINDNLVVGWSGDRRPAQKLVKQLKVIDVNTVENLFSFLNNNDVLEEIKSNGEVLYLLGIYNDGSLEIPFRWDSVAQQTDYNNATWDDFVIGSGSRHSIEILNPSNLQMIDSSGVADHLVFPLSVLGRLFCAGLISSESLEFHYGEDFEIAYLKDQKFQKFSDYNFIAMKIIKIDENTIDMDPPRMAIKKFYNEGVLCIYRVMYEYVNGNSSPHLKTDVFFIEPIDEETPNRSVCSIPDNFSMNSEYQLVFYFLDQQKTEHINPICMITKPPTFTWVKLPHDRTEIIVHEDQKQQFDDQIKSLIKHFK